MDTDIETEIDKYRQIFLHRNRQKTADMYQFIQDIDTRLQGMYTDK